MLEPPCPDCGKALAVCHCPVEYVTGLSAATWCFDPEGTASDAEACPPALLASIREELQWFERMKAEARQAYHRGHHRELWEALARMLAGAPLEVRHTVETAWRASRGGKGLDPTELGELVSILYMHGPAAVQEFSDQSLVQFWGDLWYSERTGGGVAERFLETWRGVKRLGRPDGTRTLSRDEFHAKYPDAVAKAKRKRGPHVRDEDIARALYISLPTMRRYVREYGRPEPS
jgi:hypothetical protein